MTKTLGIKEVRLDGGTQPRAAINEETVSDYAEILKDGSMPPLDVFFDGAAHWLADGFHRYHAHLRNKSPTVLCEIHAGTRRDAILFSVGANAKHGLRRTQEDRRRAIQTLLEDIEWSEWSDRDIARACSVDGKTVAKVRKTLGLEQEERKHLRNGKVVTRTVKASDEPVEPETTLDHELAAEVQSLAAENTRLHDLLAAGNLDPTPEGKQAAMQTMEALRGQIAALEREVATLRTSRDEYQAKCAELIKQVTHWKRKAEKATA